jgi:type III restriction enzyme
MPPVVIENPILNSPFDEPTRHFKFGDEGITNEVVEERRTSSYFIPIAQPKKKGKQLQFETEWTSDRLEQNRLVNLIRERVGQWRRGGHVGVTATTARLLTYWTDPEREKKLFFCQIEAVETAIYIGEVARKYGDGWIEHDLRLANDTANPGLPRLALKMATGSGKTVVMAMLIAWQALNKLEDRRDARFSDAFLIVTPGITIRDRLRVLLPTDPDNYYRQRDVLPSDLLERLGQARIVVTNYHAFLPRERGDAARLTKAILSRGEAGAFSETPEQVVRRACRDLGGKKHIVVINDEAHHCYRRKPDADVEVLVGDERSEAEKREKEARVWLSGLEAVKDKIGIRTIYDLSATPFFLKGSGYPEGTLFPWMNPDLSMGDELLKKTGAGNLFMVFGEPDITVTTDGVEGHLTVEVRGLDVYDPTTGQIRSHSTDDIACWFIDTNYNGESFFVRQAYFTGGDEPYEKLQRALRAEINEAAWSTLYSTVSRPFAPPETGKIAVKVINHYGDEVLKVYDVVGVPA